MHLAQNLYYSQQALANLFTVTNKLQMQGDRYLGEITLRQMLAVPAILHAPNNQATINQIARRLGTTKQSAKQIVNAMAKKNYLNVAPSIQDKRAVNVTITTEGSDALKACSQRADEFLADLFHAFTTEELQTLCALLDKLYSFDGTVQYKDAGHYNDSAGHGDEILRHHQSFAKRKASHHTKGNQ